MLPARAMASETQGLHRAQTAAAPKSSVGGSTPDRWNKAPIQRKVCGFNQACGTRWITRLHGEMDISLAREAFAWLGGGGALSHSNTK